MKRPIFLAVLLVALVAASACSQAAPRYMIYLHARIVEDGGRLPTDSTFGVYQYDAILDSLRRAG